MATSLEFQYIDESYQKLVQISGSYIADGTGSQINNLTLTASFADNTVSASYASASTDAQTAVSASYAVNATDAVTASFATSASHAANSTSSSYAISSSHAISSSFAVTASFVDGNVASASYAVSASHALNADNATTASYALNALSASHALISDVAGDAEDLIVGVKNTSAYTITKGTPLHATGVTGENIDVVTASCDGNIPAIGVAQADINSTAAGNAVVSGRLIGFNTNGFVAGEVVYVGLDGALTQTKPTGSHLIQNIGIIGKVDATDGEMVVLGSGRTNDLPNIAEGYLWVGDTNGVPQAVTSQSLWTGKDINVNTITASNASFTSASIGYLQAITGSAKIIGDSYIILNNDTPTERYAGIKVQDSGSSQATASLNFDGLTNDWFYEYTSSGDPDNFGVVLFGPEYSTKGSPVYLTNNKVPKSDGGHHLVDSGLLDTGTSFEFDSPITASHLEGTASLAVNLTPGDKVLAGTIDQQFSAPSSNTQKDLVTVSGVSFNGTSYPISEFAYLNYPGFGDQFANAYGISQYDGFAYTAGSELLLAPQRVQFNMTTDGSGYGTVGVMAMQSSSLGNGTQLLAYANELQIGAFRGVTINLGNRSGVALRQTENLNINAVTSSMTTDYNYSTANAGHFTTGGSRGNVTAITNGGGGGSTLSLNGGNFYTLDLTANSTTLNLNTFDIVSSYGQTFSILVDNSTTSNTLAFDSNFKFAGGTAPTITTNGYDVLTGIVFGSNNVYITAVQNLS